MLTSIDDVRFPSLVVNCYLKNICRPLNIPLYPELSANSGFLVSSNSSCHPLGSIYCVLAVFTQRFGYFFAIGVKLFHHFLPNQLS